MIPAGVDGANTPGVEKKPEWQEEKDRTAAIAETETNKKKFCGVLAEILNRKIHKDEDGNIIPVSNEDLLKVFAFNMQSNHAGLMGD